jgi:hypothetical protein
VCQPLQQVFQSSKQGFRIFPQLFQAPKQPKLLRIFCLPLNIKLLY